MSSKRVVYKYTANSDGHINFPARSTLLDVAMQDGKLTAWALVNPAYSPNNGQPNPDVLIVGTGWEVDFEQIHMYSHFRTIYEGAFVWHVFKKGA